MTKLEELIALADEVIAWDPACDDDGCTCREAQAKFIAAADPATVKRMAELLMLCREEMLAVLCDPEVEPCFSGSDGDRKVIAEALAAIDAFEKEKSDV